MASNAVQFFNTFGVYNEELDSVQIDLAMWADRYHDIYNMDSNERPGVDLIEDDHALDMYLQDLTRKRQKKSK